MKQVILFAAVIFMAGMASGVVGEDCPEGAMCIQDRAEPVSSNNTTGDSGFDQGEFDAELTVTSRECSSMDRPGKITKQHYSTLESYPPRHQLTFNGTIVTSTPCQTLEHNVTQSNGTLTMNIYSDGRGDDGVCVDCVGAVSYNASFDYVGEYFQLEVQHNGEHVGSFAPPQKINEGQMVNESMNQSEELGPKNSGDRGFLTGIVDWFRGLF